MAKKRPRPRSSERPAEARAAGARASSIIELLNGLHKNLAESKRSAVGRTGVAAREGQPLGEPLDAAVDRFAGHVSDEYTYTDSFGQVLDRKTLLQQLRAGSGLFDDFLRTVHDVRQYGRHAIVTSLVKIRGEHRGLEASGNYYETHTFEQQRNVWRLLSTHVTRIQEMNPLINKAVDACD